MENITRFELISPKGREVVLYEDMYFQLQDNGRTLKVFRDPQGLIGATKYLKDISEESENIKTEDGN